MKATALLLFATAIACASQAQATDDDAVLLPDLRVTGDISGMHNWRARLRRQLDEQAPCLGCETPDDEAGLLDGLFDTLQDLGPDTGAAATVLHRLWVERNFPANVHGAIPGANVDLSGARDIDAFERQRRILAGEANPDALLISDDP